MGVELTRVQREVLERMYGVSRKEGRMATVRELSGMMGLSPMGSVHAIVALEKKGYIERSGGKRWGFRYVLRPDGSPFRGFRDKVG